VSSASSQSKMPTSPLTQNNISTNSSNNITASEKHVYVSGFWCCL
jgi:hypothetical protein